MKKIYFFIAIVFLSNFCFAQIMMFDTSKINASSILIARYPHYDEKKTHRKLSFCISDSGKIREFLNNIIIGPEVQNTFRYTSLNISILNNYDNGKSWSINPEDETASYNGRTYQFNIDQIKKMAKLFPFDYRVEEHIFKTKETYNKYYEAQKKDSSFLFSYAPPFRFEGSFKMKFPRTDVYSSPKAIIIYINSLIEKYVSKDSFLVSYVLDKENQDDYKNYVMTVYGSKSVFEKLEVPDIKKRHWEPSIEKGIFFYRTK